MEYCSPNLEQCLIVGGMDMKRGATHPPAMTEDDGPRPTTESSWLARGLVLGPVLFTLAWFILGFLNTGYTMWDINVEEYSAISQPISGLGLGNTAPYMNTAFVVSGLLIIGGAFGLASQFTDRPDRNRWLLTALLALHGAGAVIDGFFTLESADLHFLGFLFAVSPIVTFPVLAPYLLRIPRWRRLGSRLRWASPLTLVLVVAFFVTFDHTATGSGIAGLTQRLLILEVQFWLVLMGWMATKPNR